MLGNTWKRSAVAAFALDVLEKPSAAWQWLHKKAYLKAGLLLPQTARVNNDVWPFNVAGVNKQDFVDRDELAIDSNKAT